MGKDFRIGLVVGLVLAGAVLFWVATRPSLNPQVQKARVPQLSQADHPDSGLPIAEGELPTEDSLSSTNPQSAIIHLPSALPDLTVFEKAEKIKTTKFHIVRRGESLAGIARQYYGSPEAWRKILAANQKVIKDPNKIAPGTKLIIPD